MGFKRAGTVATVMFSSATPNLTEVRQRALSIRCADFVGRSFRACTIPMRSVCRSRLGGDGVRGCRWYSVSECRLKSSVLRLRKSATVWNVPSSANSHALPSGGKAVRHIPNRRRLATARLKPSDGIKTPNTKGRNEHHR